MTQVLVRSSLPLSWIRNGAELRVQETDDIKTAVADGKLIVLARFDDTGNPVDPEPGDDNWDEYSSEIDAELAPMFDADIPAPTPPPARKARRRDAPDL